MNELLSSLALLTIIAGSVYAVFRFPLVLSARSRTDSRYGYTENPYHSHPRRAFGWASYHVYRDDSQALHATLITKNPWSIHRKQRTKNGEQAESLCQVCNEECGNGIGNRADGGSYFVETWRVLCLFGIAVRFECTDWDAYCPRHDPREWPHEQTTPRKSRRM